MDIDKIRQLQQMKHEERMAEIHRQVDIDIQEHKKRVAEFEADLFDEDGYPSEAALEMVKDWHWSDPLGLMKFVKQLWKFSDWGWSEKESIHSLFSDQKVIEYHVSTGGWSGNESVIRFMQSNQMLWHFIWVQSRRGGHYIFEVKVNEAETN